MALAPTRLEFRVTLSHVDRGRDVTETVIVQRHPSERHQHAILRMLGWCLFNEDGLEFGPGLSTPDTPDLWTREATGRLTSWIECGSADADKLRKLLSHHSGCATYILFDDEKRARELSLQLAGVRWPRGNPFPAVFLVDAALVATLAAREERRQKWGVTLVGDHFYIDVDGRSLNGGVERVDVTQAD